MRNYSISVYKRIKKYLNYSKTWNLQLWQISQEVKGLSLQMQQIQVLEIALEY